MLKWQGWITPFYFFIEKSPFIQPICGYPVQLTRIVPSKRVVSGSSSCCRSVHNAFVASLSAGTEHLRSILSRNMATLRYGRGTHSLNHSLVSHMCMHCVYLKMADNCTAYSLPAQPTCVASLVSKLGRRLTQVIEITCIWNIILVTELVCTNYFLCK